MKFFLWSLSMSHGFLYFMFVCFVSPLIYNLHPAVSIAVFQSTVMLKPCSFEVRCNSCFFTLSSQWDGR